MLSVFLFYITSIKCVVMGMLGKVGDEKAVSWRRSKHNTHCIHM